MCVLGAPGTGKTTVLAERFVKLATDGASSDRILFLMPNRVQKMRMQDALTKRLLGREGVRL